MPPSSILLDHAVEVLAHRTTGRAAARLVRGVTAAARHPGCGSEAKVGKNLLATNLALAASKGRNGFRIPAARRVLVCQFADSVRAAADQNLLVYTHVIYTICSARGSAVSEPVAAARLAQSAIGEACRQGSIVRAMGYRLPL